MGIDFLRRTASPFPPLATKPAVDFLAPIFLTGQADANGNLTISFKSPEHFWIACYLTLTAAGQGAPSYVLQLGAGVPIALGQGLQAQLGPVIIEPGQVVKLVCAGLSGKALVSGTARGWQAQNPADLPALLPLAVGSALLSSAKDLPLQSLGQAVLGAAPGTTSVNFNLPPGAVGLLLISPIGSEPSSFSVIGFTTGLHYLVAGSGDGNLRLPNDIWGCLLGPDDSTVTVAGSGPTTGGATVNVYAVFSLAMAAYFPLINRGTLPTATTQSEFGTTKSIAGIVTAPAAGAAIVSVTPGAGWYRAQFYGGYGATGDAAANMNVQVAGTAVRRVAYPGGANVMGPRNVIDRINVGAAQALTINAVGAGVAGSVYVAIVDLTPVP